jgi:hypothetical protein
MSLTDQMLFDSRVYAKQSPFKDEYGSGLQGFSDGRNTNAVMLKLFEESLS